MRRGAAGRRTAPHPSRGGRVTPTVISDVWREAASMVEALAATEAHAVASRDRRTWWQRLWRRSHVVVSPGAAALFSAARILEARARAEAVEPPARFFIDDMTPEVQPFFPREAMRSELIDLDDDDTEPFSAVPGWAGGE